MPSLKNPRTALRTAIQSADLDSEDSRKSLVWLYHELSCTYIVGKNLFGLHLGAFELNQDFLWKSKSHTMEVWIYWIQAIHNHIELSNRVCLVLNVVSAHSLSVCIKLIFTNNFLLSSTLCPTGRSLFLKVELFFYDDNHCKYILINSNPVNSKKLRVCTQLL